jgi:hypothetical protein
MEPRLQRLDGGIAAGIEGAVTAAIWPEHLHGAQRGPSSSCMRHRLTEPELVLRGIHRLERDHEAVQVDPRAPCAGPDRLDDIGEDPVRVLLGESQDDQLGVSGLRDHPARVRERRIVVGDRDRVPAVVEHASIDSLVFRVVHTARYHAL